MSSSDDDDQFLTDISDAAMALAADSDEDDGDYNDQKKMQGIAAKSTPAAGIPRTRAMPVKQRTPESWQWWERNERPHRDRFVDAFRCPLPAALLRVDGTAASAAATTMTTAPPPHWELVLAQCDGGDSPDSDAQVTIWDAAIVLHRIMLRDGPSCFRGKTVVEIGAGGGLPGLTAALLGAKVLLTDLPEVLPTLAANVARNRRVLLASHATADVMSCAVAELYWSAAHCCIRQSC